MFIYMTFLDQGLEINYTFKKIYKYKYSSYIQVFWEIGNTDSLKKKNVALNLLRGWNKIRSWHPFWSLLRPSSGPRSPGWKPLVLSKRQNNLHSNNPEDPKNSNHIQNLTSNHSRLPQQPLSITLSIHLSVCGPVFWSFFYMTV